MENKIYLSYSGMSCFMDCKRMYYWRYIQQLELIQFSPHFIIGNAIDFGISLLYEKDANTIKKTLMEFSKLRKKLRGEMSLNIQQEQELNNQETIIVGMLDIDGTRAFLISSTGGNDSSIEEILASIKVL